MREAWAPHVGRPTPTRACAARRNDVFSLAPKSGTLLAVPPVANKEADMVVMKADYPRQIDRVIDYFGAPRPVRVPPPKR